MTQQLYTPTPRQPLLRLNLRGVNQLFPGFAEGDFMVIRGSSSALTSMLCIQAQLGSVFGGLNSNVVFIDGGNTFDLYQVAQQARLFHLDPKKILDGIFISRAFTAYQLTALVMQRLKLAIQQFQAKVVIISDIAGFFTDKALSEREAERVFSQVLTYLSNFARENHIVLFTTVMPHRNNPTRFKCLETMLCKKASVVLSLTRTETSRYICLEKHPYCPTGSVELPTNTIRLTDFMEADD
jgi:hypothetical protein